MIMRLTRFLITSLIDRRKTWFVSAGDMGSAWRRFVADDYGGNVHDAGSYDIRYHSFIIIHRKRPKNAAAEFLTKVHEEYTVVDGIIRNPGKYECECVWVPYYWELALDGEGEDKFDEDGESMVTRFVVDDE